MIMNKSEVIELLKSGAELFFTSYQTEKEVKNHSYDSNDIVEVILIGAYDGDYFEYNYQEVIDGDMIYKVIRKSVDNWIYDMLLLS